MPLVEPIPTPLDPHDPGSVTLLVPRLKEGDRAALGELYERYFLPLVRVATRRLFTPQGQGAEDVALDALLEFCRSLQRPDVEQRYPDLHSRANLWRLLVCFVVRGAYDYNQEWHHNREILFSLLGEDVLARLDTGEPGPEVEVAVAHLLGLLDDASLRAVAVLRMHGYTNKEIGQRLQRAESTIEVKLRLIREVWRARGIDPFC